MPIPHSNKTVHNVKAGVFLKICGLTLVEMLIVSMILGVISITINSALNSGVRVWRKINQELPQEAINIFFDKFTTDLHNTFNSTNIKLEGDDERLELPAFVSSRRFSGRLPGEVIYVYDKGKDELYRQAKDYSDVYSDKQGVITPLIKNIHSLKFTYYFFEAERKYYAWVDTWEKEWLPQAVRVELEVNDENKIKQFTRTVSIPLAK
jgi:hypothetical protein